MSFSFDAGSYRYPSRRRVVFAGNGMVCASQPLAAQAGVDALRRGGNAVDAVLAAAGCLTVLEPASNGLGGDAFAIVWHNGRMYGLNSSGPAPALADAAFLREKYGRMPAHGWYPVNVPGIPAAWAALNGRFGRLSLAETLSAAIGYAEGGFPVEPVSAKFWQSGCETYSALGDEFGPWMDTFAPKGHAPRAGEIVRLPQHGESLREIAETNAESFYRGRLAGKIDAASRAGGGWLRAEDLAEFYPEWVEPMSVDYRGFTVHELPPNGHGLVVLETLALLSGLEMGSGDAGDVHRQIEAMKLAYADGLKYIAEPSAMRVAPSELLGREYLARRRALIGDTAREPEAGDPHCGGTVYLCAADGEGNMVSYIQSNYMGFGSGIVVPGTGIALHDRGCNFSLEEGAANCLAPGKRPYHTIIPGFLTRNGEAVGPFGVMGAFMQPQGHVQAVMNMIDYGCNPQEALDAPRWQWKGGKSIELEPGFDGAIAEELKRRGHEVSVGDPYEFGRGQIILRDENGTLCGATEPRTDGGIAAY